MPALPANAEERVYLCLVLWHLDTSTLGVERNTFRCSVPQPSQDTRNRGFAHAVTSSHHHVVSALDDEVEVLDKRGIFTTILSFLFLFFVQVIDKLLNPFGNLLSLLYF